MTLKGKFYQRSVASTGKLKGLVSLALAYQTYAHYSCIAAWTGITLPAVAGAGLLYYGLNQFHENNHLHSVEVTEDGKVKIAVGVSPFVSKTYITEPQYVSRVGASLTDPSARLQIS